MMWSQFIFKLIDCEKIILFNTYNKATILLNYDIYSAINDFIDGVNMNVDKEYIENLIQLGFLISKNYDEKLNFLNEVCQVVDNDNKFNLVVLTTTACNFKCEYCYEMGINRRKSFTIKDVNLIIACLESRLDFNKIKVIELTLFGGEPTLNWNFITHLLKELYSFCLSKDIRLVIDMITNGYLLNKEKVDLLLDYNFQNIQITLDGNRDVHDSRRVLLNGKGTFNKIIENIHYLLETGLSSVTIRVNYDQSNIKDMDSFIDFLINEFKDFKDRIKISFGIIDENLVEGRKGFKLDYNSELFRHYLKFYEMLMRSGFRYDKYFQTGAVCMAKRNNSLIVSPDKRIYKCLSLVGVEGGGTGYFPEDIGSKKNHLNIKLYDECFKRGCEFIPMCHTGCRYKSLIKTCSIDKADCEYESLSEINKGIIKRLYNV